MRDILFRAKRLDNGEWAKSRSIAENISNDGQCSYFIGARQPALVCVNKEGNIMATETSGAALFYAVDPETIGQYTGLTDKNDKKIFEGDIIRSSDPEWPEGTLDCGIGQVEFYAGLWYVSGEVHNSLNELVLSREIEVIGNIHDNPGLMKEDE